MTYRLENNLYVDLADALRDFDAHAEIYNEAPRLEPFRAVIVANFDPT